ncbi:MAG: threonylcarbamoyl-AMP synthase [Bacteroidaceae bacterium]|nr:threonylcarbamoyl-AMP synthase [Bacteroidaceae bacterium]
MLIRLYEKNTSQKDIDRVLDILNGGGVAILPTDTAYAMCCHALKERPIERICRLKGMDVRKHRFSIICYDLSDISQYVQIDNSTFKAMKRNLPGPFTFVLRAGSRLPKVFSNRKEVGIRVPDNTIVREICRQLGAPLLATTIPFNENADDIAFLTDPELIDERFGDDVDIVVNGGNGDCQYSTVIYSVNGDQEILRQGKGVLKD